MVMMASSGTFPPRVTCLWSCVSPGARVASWDLQDIVRAARARGACLIDTSTAADKCFLDTRRVCGTRNQSAQGAPTRRHSQRESACHRQGRKASIDPAKIKQMTAENKGPSVAPAGCPCCREIWKTTMVNASFISRLSQAVDQIERRLTFERTPMLLGETSATGAWGYGNEFFGARRGASSLFRSKSLSWP